LITIVSGLPRSGTSLMMQMLAAGGLPSLTDGDRKPDIDNPRGYCEWEPIKQLPKDPMLIDQSEGKAVKIIDDPAHGIRIEIAEKGKEVFQQCGVCHNADTDEKKMGPGLKGLFKKDKLANGKKPTETNIRAQIDDGGNGMPPYKESLGDGEKDDLIAYLKTL